MPTILIILIVLFVISRLLRYLMPYILRRVQNKMEARMREYANNGHSQTETSVREGETVVVSKPKQQQTAQTDDMGDYVDFEEVD